MAIYTSRYQNKELQSGKYTVVGITRGAPRFTLGYVLAGNIMDIAPPGWLFNEYDKERFTESYCRNMDNIGVKRIRDVLTGYTLLGKDVVLCCYEDVRKPGEWCHRQVFAEWWKSATGEEIVELSDASEIKGMKRQDENKREQLSFDFSID